MKQFNDLPDEEIHQHMNFEELLQKHTQLKTKAGSGLKSVALWSLVALIILAPAAYLTITNLTSGEEVQETGTSQSAPMKDNSEAKEESAVTTPIDTAEQLAVKSETKEISKASMPKENSLPGKSQPPTAERKNEEEQKSVYVQAEPIDGYDKLYKYFDENLKYPGEVVSDSIQGVVTISFIIDEKGAPKQLEIRESLGPLFDHESKRLIENMPGWKPATLNGKPVQSRISLPLTFRIQVSKGDQE